MWGKVGVGNLWKSEMKRGVGRWEGEEKRKFVGDEQVRGIHSAQWDHIFFQRT